MKTIEVIYQAAGAATGRTVQMEVYKPDKTKDEGQSIALTEIGTTGRYYGSFQADAADWSVQVADNDGGKCVKHYGKDIFDSIGVSALVANVQTAVDNVADAITTLQSLTGTVDGKIDVIDANVDSLVSTIGSLASGLGIVESKIDALESGPMIG